MPTAFLSRKAVRMPRLSVYTNFDRDSAKEVHECAAHPRRPATPPLGGKCSCTRAPGIYLPPPRHGIWLSAYDPGGPDQPQNLPCQRGSLAWEWMDHYPAIQTPPEQCRFGRGSPSFAWGHCPRFRRTGGYSPLKRLTDVHRSERSPQWHTTHPS
jgi:hypothetical protein